MKVIPRERTWQVHFTDMKGERVRASTGVRVDPNLPDKGKGLAVLAGAEKMRAHLLDSDLPVEAKKAAGKALNLSYALRQALADRWSGQRSSKHKAYVVNRLIRDIGYWPLHTINFSRLQSYGKELECAGDSPATRNRKMSAIHTAMTDAKRRGEIESVPEFPHYAENNIKERYLTRIEETRLISSMAENAAPADAEAHYLIHMTLFLLDTGLRAGEAILDASQDLGDRIWLLHGTTKSGKGRTVPLTKRARCALDEILASPVHAHLHALKARSKELPTNRLGRWFRNACARAGIAGASLHTLRHTCASRLVQAGVSLYVVKEWLGHSSITITERYAHLAPKNLEAAAAALEPITTRETKADAKVETGDRKDVDP